MNREKNVSKSRLFTSEHVSPGHPDKLADQISDACLDAIYAVDRSLTTRVAVETMLKGNVVIIAGEVSCAKSLDIDYEAIVRQTLRNNFYTKEYSPMYNDEDVIVVNLISEQSKDIAQCVNSNERKGVGAGDQGIMFGYAVDEAPDMTGWCHYLSRYLVDRIYEYFIQHIMDYETINKYFPDFKVQVTCAYDDDKVFVRDVNVSIAHENAETLDSVRKEVGDFVRRMMLYLAIKHNALEIADTTYHVNANGPFTIYGPIADTGLTGRKIVCDQYGGYAPVGGGAFSGKDLTKIDRTAAYMARYFAQMTLREIKQGRYYFGGTREKVRSVQCNVSYIIGDVYPVTVDFIVTFDNGETEYITAGRDIIERFSVENMCDMFLDNIKSFEKLSARCHIGTTSANDEIKPWEFDIYGECE